MNASSTTTTTEKRCRTWGQGHTHAPHGRCPGLTPLGSLTLSQIEDVAAVLEMPPWDLTIRIVRAHEAEQVGR